ncbi:MAG: DeoR family transcriptional regulator [Anaerolineales bacterium]
MNQRQRLLLERLSTQEVLTIADLAQELSVSKMTIHRDLEALQQAGLILKRHGKIFATAKLRGEDATHCQMCNRNIAAQNLFTLLTREGRKISYCCPHCGLLAYGCRQDVWQSLATDFLHGHVISAWQAYFLVEPGLQICCSPSVLAFASEEEVKRFQKGFGGRIETLQAAIDFLTQSSISMKNYHSEQGGFDERTT